MVQLPTAIALTTFPATEQVPDVFELNTTDKPELAIALTAPTPPTATDGAAFQLRSPTWFAWIVHAPTAMPVTVTSMLETVHTLGVALLNETGSPEVAVAPIESTSARFSPSKGAKAIAWLPLFTTSVKAWIAFGGTLLAAETLRR